MMKLKKKIFTLLLVGCVACSALTACGEKAVLFANDEYDVRSGDKITASGSATYVLLGDVPEGVSVSEKGVFTVAENVADGTQVLLGAVANGKVMDTAVCRITVETVAPEIEFTNLSGYIVDGETVSATSTPDYAISYTMKEDSPGISIDEVSGKVSFTDKVAEKQAFTVVASAKGVSEERTFYAAIRDMVRPVSDTAIAEWQGTDDVSFTLAFPSAEVKEEGVLGVSCGKERADADDYAYDADTAALTVKRSFLNTLQEGENLLKIATAKNTVTVTVKHARFVATAEELAAIGQTQESLGGYYVQVSDINLTPYLSETNEGWYPVGTYKDVTDGTATEMAFNGTYDGNGHTVSGFYINRSDAVAYNSGLFGYVTSNAKISNLNLVGDETRTHAVRSYSGALVGVNCGVIENCSVYANVNAEGCKVVGIFVGRNEGTISDSYAFGSVVAEEKVGAFCGENQNKIQSCYAATEEKVGFCGVGGTDETVYATVEELYEKADFTSWEGWTVKDGKPQINGVAVRYALRSITVVNERTEYVKGMKFRINVLTNPSDTEGMQFAYGLVSGTGVTVDEKGNVDLTDAANGSYTVRVSCGEVYADYTFAVKDSVEDIVTIYTVDDFMAFKADVANYSKTVILMADLDFAGAEITSVGYYYESEQGDVDLTAVFSGVFDGNGHSIKNVKIVRNSYDKPTGNGNYDSNRYHASYYNVGLFSYVTGTVKNLTLTNVNVTPTYEGEGTGNFVGVVCGALFGSVENCILNGCTYYGAGDDSLRTGIVCGSNYGSVINVTVDGALYGE